MKRRQIIKVAGATLTLPSLTVLPCAAAAAEKPQVGDLLAHAFGERVGTVISPGEVAEALIFAFPLTLDGSFRSTSLHSQISLLRLDEAAMTDKTRGYAAGPYVAVSAACTHTGCEVSGWQPDASELECPCHGSRFNVLDAARVVNGPATKPLAYLPIELDGEVFRVTGSFSRRVGPAPVF